MDKELLDELNYEIQLLLKLGFYSDDEILEIIDDEFIEENLSEESISKVFLENKKNFEEFENDSEDFRKLEEVFLELSGNKILTIHNAGYDIEEGIQDAFELFVHLRNNKIDIDGFAFYSFEDIESAIEAESLKIAFGDFEYDEKKGLEIGKRVANALKSAGFDLSWNESIDERIIINDFKWEKAYSGKEYSMDGALETYIELNKE